MFGSSSGANFSLVDEKEISLQICKTAVQPTRRLCPSIWFTWPTGNNFLPSLRQNTEETWNIVACFPSQIVFSPSRHLRIEHESSRLYLFVHIVDKILSSNERYACMQSPWPHVQRWGKYNCCAGSRRSSTGKYVESRKWAEWSALFEY